MGKAAVNILWTIYLDKFDNELALQEILKHPVKDGDTLEVCDADQESQFFRINNNYESFKLSSIRQKNVQS